MSGSTIGWVIVLLIAGVIVYNLNKPSVWTAVYENSNEVMVQKGGDFKDKDSCLRWIYSARLANKDSGNYGYECGKDCKPPETPYGLYVCSETVDY